MFPAELLILLFEPVVLLLLPSLCCSNRACFRARDNACFMVSVKMTVSFSSSILFTAAVLNRCSVTFRHCRIRCNNILRCCSKDTISSFRILLRFGSVVVVACSISICSYVVEVNGDASNAFSFRRLFSFALIASVIVASNVVDADDVSTGAISVATMSLTLFK